MPDIFLCPDSYQPSCLHSAAGRFGEETISRPAFKESQSTDPVIVIVTDLLARSYLEVLLPLLASSLSLGYLSIQSILRTVKLKRKNGYQLLSTSNGHVNGLRETSFDVVHGDSRPLLDPIDTQTDQSFVAIDRPKGETILVISEVLALVGEVVVHLVALSTHAWGRNGTVAAVAGVATWSYIFTLAMLRLFRINARLSHIPKLWNHTAILYGIEWLLTVIPFRSALIHPQSKVSRNLLIVDFALVTVLALVALTSRKGNKPVVLEYEDNIKPSREPLASVLSLLTFSWVDAIVWHGYRHTFELPAVWNLMARDRAAAVLADFRQLKKTSALTWHLLKYFKRGLLMQASWSFASGLFTFVPTVLLKVFLEFVENPGVTPINVAWFYIIILASSTCIQAITDGQALWIGRKICIRLRAVIIGEIYSKALRRKAAAGRHTVLGEESKADSVSPKPKKGLLSTIRIFRSEKKEKVKAADASEFGNDSADSQVNVGTIINLMAVDSFKVSEISAYLHFLWATTPVQLVMCIILLYRVLGYSSFISIGLMAAVLPLNVAIARQFNKTQKIIMAATDARIHTTNEVLQNIRIIKYFAWEIRFGHIVNEKRRTELRSLRNRYILWALAATLWFSVPLLITLFSFMMYTLVEKKPLIPSVAFTALSLFNILRIPLDQLADMIAHVQESKVSVDRVEEFLNEEETEKYDQLRHSAKDESGETIIGFDRATFTWGARDLNELGPLRAFRMISLNIKFRVGGLNIVAGPTGSGKTSLLMALLGEMTKLDGSVYLPSARSREDLVGDPSHGLTECVAYCAQQAWLVNDTIRQNILFASPPNEARYKAVVAACALGQDLAILDNGDQTLVGEKGITLSGGQKQRVSLARALYSNSRHVLLDDCLSAVDSHTASHIFEQGIMGPLMTKRTCILVTHNIALCLPLSDHVVVLANGKIAAQGTPNEVLSSGALGDEVSKSGSASRSETRLHSRTTSTEDFEVISHGLNGQVKKDTGETNGSIEELNKAMKGDLSSARIEKKAEGGVKIQVIKMYLSAMGPWYYWLLTFIIFTAQQLGSVVCNIWIRQWANSYQIESRETFQVPMRKPKSHYIVGASNALSSSCLSGGTCPYNFPFLSYSPDTNPSLATASGVDPSYYLVIYALFILAYVCLSFTREGIVFYGSLAASWKLHLRLLEAVTRAKFKFFDSTPLGQIMNRFSKDVEAVDQEVASIAVGMLSCVFSVIIIVILISAITPAFLIAGLFIAAVYIAVGAFYLRSSVDLKRLESVQRSPLYQQFGETLSGIITIRAYGHERRFTQDNLRRIDTHNRPFISLWATNRWLALRVDILGALVSFFAGAFVIFKIKSIDAGAAGLSMTYAVMFSENVLWLVRLYSMNEQNMNSVERIKEYLEVEQEAKAVIPETRPPGNWPSFGAIKFINYSTRYRDDLDPVLKSITFNIQPGERVGIVGRTGAGKSSLALALFRGLEATEGKIVIDDIDIGLIGLQDLREAITIVPQDPTLFTGTIRSNLDPFGLFTDEEIFATLRRVQLIGAEPPSRPNTAVYTQAGTSSSSSTDDEPSGSTGLAKTFTNTRENANLFESLSSAVAESGSNLSQGQRQLLCLARALLKAPRVLLMDEATASIDYATDSKIQGTLREVKGSTIITIAHRLQTIIDYDKILVLEKGKVVEFDAPWKLIAVEGGVFQGMCEMSGDMETLTEEARRASTKKSSIIDA